MEHLDGERYLLLSSLDETIIQGNSEFNLGIHKYEGDNYVPKGHKYLRDFEADPVPKLVYRVGGVVIEKERLLVQNEQQFLIRYKILEADKSTKIRFRPFLAFRNIHKLSKANTYANTKVKFIANGIKSRLYDGFPYLHMQFSKKVEYIHSPDWYYNIEYLEEQRRGYDYKEDLFVPGYFEMNVKKGEVLIFSASTKLANPETLKRKFTLEIEKRIPRNDFKNCLINSAQQFIMKRDRKTEIIAGFHWFGSWGRDTFIALPGLTLATGDTKTCKAVIDTMVSKLANGLFPNIESSDEAAYNSVDASLWFFWALQQYAKHINSYLPVWKTYSKPINSILNAYRNGTLFNIKMQENGLIYAGEKGNSLTWMDAIINGIPVTPRVGAPVEINALWYNALMFSLDLARKSDDEKFVNRWKKLPALVKESFIKEFWDRNRGYLADYIDSNSKDWTVRPNQVIATSLEFSPLDNEMKTSILNIVERDLLTPRGLRTLCPKNKDYMGTCEGNQEQRDKAYHQGTVWPWLLEHFCEAYINLYKDCGLQKVKKIIQEFEATMNEHGIGTISEIYDGDPPHYPRGAISQAWSVAALLRIIEKTENFSQEVI
jgi:predicted glycogen debranching enzyme